MPAPEQMFPQATKYQEPISYKNNCVHAQLGQIMDKTQKDQKKKKTTTNQLPHLKSQQQNMGLGQKQGTVPAPCTQHHRRVCKPPVPPLQPEPWTHPPTPTKEVTLGPACPAPLGGAEGPVACSRPHCCSRGSSEDWPDFGVWPLLIFS